MEEGLHIEAGKDLRSSFSINGVEYSVEKARLRKWLELEDLRTLINQAVETRHIGDIAQAIYRYVSTACGISVDELQSASWIEVVFAWTNIEMLNSVDKEYPIFLPGKHDIMKEADWDYPGRSVFSVLHHLCKAYGWTLDYASEMNVEDGIAMMQEALIEAQLEREWQWSLTEMAYKYEPSSKTSRFQPLPRPSWMMGKPKPLKAVKIRKSMLPVGNIVDLAGVGLHGIDAIKH